MNTYYAIYACFSDGERPPFICKRLSDVTRMVRGFLTMKGSEIPTLRITRVRAE